MGALHAGHLSLLDRSREDNDVSVVSIFVNPTQFDKEADLSTYPRTIEADKTQLIEHECDILFLPAEHEIYPEPATETYDLGPSMKLLEGENRPGHFNGVAQIVRRLFEAVTPDRAYFGEKDFQQVMVIKALVAQLQMHIQIVPCHTAREADGLAMSSRNTLLTPEFRQVAPVLYEAISMVGGDVSCAEEARELIRSKGLELEYLEVMPEWERVLVAAWAGNVRLIDNIPII